MFDKYYETFNVENLGRLARLLLWAPILGCLLRYVFNPEPLVFPSGIASMEDYWSMVGMSSLLIALDAMLLVVLNFRRLRNAWDALILAAMVGFTHVVFPLTTFAITAAAYYPVKAGLVPAEYSWVSAGIVTAIYIIAFHFVTHHLREVTEGIYSHNIDEAPEGLRSFSAAWDARKPVFAVSIDALIVGPAKIAFMDRYPPEDFAMSFVYIGIGVFTLVLMSGLAVIFLRWLLKSTDKMATVVKLYDKYSSMLLAFVFIHFSVFAACYLAFNLTADAVWLETPVIWGFTFVFGLYFLWGIEKDEYHEALEARANYVQSEAGLAAT